MTQIRDMRPDAIAAKARAARALHNVGWRMQDIAEALSVADGDVKTLINMRVG